jgi:hypothetical protein
MFLNFHLNFIRPKFESHVKTSNVRLEVKKWDKISHVSTSISNLHGTEILVPCKIEIEKLIIVFEEKLI